MNGGVTQTFRFGGGFPPNAIPDFLKDTDNLLILVLILILMKQKSNTALVVALLSVFMSE